MKKPNKFKTDDFLSRKHAELAKKPKLTDKELRRLAEDAKAIPIVKHQDEPAAQLPADTTAAIRPTTSQQHHDKKRKRPGQQGEAEQSSTKASKKKRRDASAAAGIQETTTADHEETAPAAQGAPPGKKLKLTLPPTTQPAGAVQLHANSGPDMGAKMKIAVSLHAAIRS